MEDVEDRMSSGQTRIPVTLLAEGKEVTFVLLREHLLLLQEEAGHRGEPALPNGFPIGEILVLNPDRQDLLEAVATFLLGLRDLNDLAVQEALSLCAAAALVLVEVRPGIHAFAGVPFGSVAEYEDGMPELRRSLPQLRAMALEHERTAGTRRVNKYILRTPGDDC